MFLAEAARQNRLSNLEEMVSRASSARPAWAGGKAILALIDIHRGNDDQARARLLPLIESDQSPMPAHARRVIVSVMDGAPALHDLALRIADGVSDTSLTNWMTAYRGSLAQIHVDLYRSSGQFAKARELAMKSFQSVSSSRLEGGDYQSTRQLMKINSIGRHLMELEDPLDAVRVYGSTLLRKRVDSQDRDWVPIASGLERALEVCRVSDPSTILDELVPESAPKGAVVDLLTFVFPDEPDRVALISVLDESVKQAGAEPGRLDAFRERLDRARKVRPRSLAIEIAAALVALATRRDETAAVERLERVVAEAPLEKLKPKGRANARQRAAAAEQVGLWLVAHAASAGYAAGARRLGGGRRPGQAGLRPGDPPRVGSDRARAWRPRSRRRTLGRDDRGDGFALEGTGKGSGCYGPTDLRFAGGRAQLAADGRRRFRLSSPP